MAATLAEEVKRRKVAEALLNGDENNDDSYRDIRESEETDYSTDQDLSQTEDMGEKPSSASEEEERTPEVSTADAEKTPRLGYRFVPVSPLVPPLMAALSTTIAARSSFRP